MSSIAYQAFNYIGYVLSALSLVAVAAMVCLQLRTYRRTRHPSLKLLLFASTSAAAYSLLAIAARALLHTPTVALAIYCFAAFLAVLHLILAIVGTARLFRAFEAHAVEWRGPDPKNCPS